ncbi:MAG: transposase [Bryobacterales bacterium]|nr:transposase [Bryobacterales bacterium]
MRAHTTILARCKLTRAGYQRMFQIRRSLSWLYNQALEQRKTAWESDKKNVSYFDQCRRLTLLRREDPQGLGAIALGPQRGMLKRLDEAFQAFFSRLKAGQDPGYPRFKPLSRCVTIDVTQLGPRMVRKQGQRYVIRIRGFPRIECFPSRELPGGHRLKSLRLTLRGRRWEASLAYAVQKQALPSCTRAVGVDLGVRKRMTLSNGAVHAGHRRDWREIRRLKRKVSRCKRGSKNRRKAMARLARFWRRESVRERNACHRATTGIIRKHGLVAVERLRVANMTRSARGTKEEPGKNVAQKAGLNREILSQNWSLLRNQLQYKAAWAGREYVEVDPKFTSRDCHRCGARNDPGQSETYECRACGLVTDRDVNAAINVLAAGVLAAGASTWAAGPCVAPEPYT